MRSSKDFFLYTKKLKLYKDAVRDVNACIKSKRIYDIAYDKIYDIDELKL